MAWQASGLVGTSVINSQRVLFYIRQFILGLNPAHVTIVDSDAAGGNWNAEDGPGNGAYLVLQGAHSEGGVRWQLMIAGRSTAGNIGGYTGSYNGVYVVWGPDGGWSSVTKTFGNAVQAGPIKVDRTSAANMGPFNMEMAVIERVNRDTGLVDGEAFLWLGDSGKDGVWESGVYAGHFYQAEKAVAKQTICCIGAPTTAMGSGNWGQPISGGGNCLMWSWPLTTLEGGRVENAAWTSGWLLTGAGQPFGFPLLVYNGSVGRVWGYLCEVYRTDSGIANGTRNAAGTRVVYNNLAWPSKV